MILAFSLSGRIPSKKNSRITTKSGRSFPSKAYSAWHKDAMAQLMFLGIGKDGIEKCSVELHIRFPDLRRADLTNKAESVMDLLVDYGLLADDNWKVVGRVVLSGDLDRENPGVDIIVEVEDE